MGQSDQANGGPLGKPPSDLSKSTRNMHKKISKQLISLNLLSTVSENAEKGILLQKMDTVMCCSPVFLS